MPKRILFKTNDYCWAIYDQDSKELLAWGQYGNDPFFALQRLGQKLGFTAEHAELENLDGDAPKDRLE